MVRQSIVKYFKKALKEAKNELPLPDFKESEITLEIPSNPAFGDYASPLAINIAKKIKEDPIKVAKILEREINKAIPPNFFSKIEVVPPGFINFFLSEKTIKQIFNKLTREGPERARKKRETVIIDYSSPNIAKPMSIAHLRSTIIGAALYNIFNFLGYKTISDNHLGDWGTQFGKLIVAWKKAKQKPRKISVRYLFDLYTKFHQEAKQQPILEEQAKKEIQKLQLGDKENKKLWELFRDVSLRDFKKIYKRLKIKFDYCLGESFYNKYLPKIVQEALSRGVAQKSQGAVAVDLNKFSLPIFIIQKSDGSYLYSTTELATLKHRISLFNPKSILYVVGNEQTLHFQQIFKTAKLLGYDKKCELQHVKFGLIKGEDKKKFSTRRGRTIFLESVIDEAVGRALQIVEKKNPKLSLREKRDIAEMVGIGALKYNDLSQNRLTDIKFEWDKMLNFEGNSTPYLQYSFTRLESILKKAKFKKLTPPLKNLKEYDFSKEEIALLKQLFHFDEILEAITKNFFPNQLADYLYQLAIKINNFYEKVPVLKSPAQERGIRLALIYLAAEVLKTGLNLLGIEAPKKM